MSAITQRERTVKQLVLDTCWEYLQSNFSKFSDANKLKVAMALCQKTIPQEVTGMSQQIVVMNEIKKGNDPLRFEIGEPVIASTPGHS